MTDLFLIAHKVHGEPAFDVAQKMECPVCHNANSCGDYEGPSCIECEGDGFWWIIPTSGHRAFPYWHCDFIDLAVSQGNMEYYGVTSEVPEMPLDLPDHYPHSASPTKPKLDITALLIPASVKIQRRF